MNVLTVPIHVVLMQLAAILSVLTIALATADILEMEPPVQVRLQLMFIDETRPH